MKILDDNTRPWFNLAAVTIQLQEEFLYSDPVYTAQAQDLIGGVPQKCECTYSITTQGKMFLNFYQSLVLFWIHDFIFRQFVLQLVNVSTRSTTSHIFVILYKSRQHIMCISQALS